MTTRIGIGDDPQTADENAYAVKAHYERSQTMAKLIAGHAVEVVNDCNDLTVRLRVGGHVFECPRAEYPTPELVANVVLAIDAANYAPEAFAIGDLVDEDLQLFDPRFRGLSRATEQRLRKEELEITAGDNARREATKKGLRPLTEIEQLAKGVRW